MLLRTPKSKPRREMRKRRGFFVYNPKTVSNSAIVSYITLIRAR